MNQDPNIPSFLVIFDCQTFDVGSQGTSTYLAGVINELPRTLFESNLNLNLKIVCASSSKNSVDKFIEVPYSFQQIRSGFIYRNLIDLPRLISDLDADLVVSQYVRPFFSSAPTLSVIHDVLFMDYPEYFSWSYRMIRKFFFRWSARNSTYVSTVSRYSADRLEFHFGLAKENILITPNAVDSLFIKKNRDEKHSNKILQLLTVSRLEKRKRHEWGIDAIAALRLIGIDASLVIVGDGDNKYAKKIRNLVKKAKYEKNLNIFLKSEVNFSDLVQEYFNADVFICCSKAEGFGIPVIEAAAAGLTCISSNGGALKELENQFSGILVPSEDREGFINAVITVATNITKYRKEANQGRIGVAKTYNWNHATNKYIDIFKLVLSNKTK